MNNPQLMMTSDDNIRYMRQALKQARKGRGRTSPNPCVGAVIVKNDRIIAAGYHKKAGSPHAEIMALEQAGEEAVGAVMYVTLEPCNHTGRTPPCSHAVAESGIAEVVIGMLDPNPLVDGSGADYLRSRGVGIVHGILEEQCREINRPFIKHITTGRPLVIMKAGLSLDGRLAYRKGHGGAVTGPESSRLVHRLRDETDAILVGISTVNVDDPSLTTRLGNRGGRDPVRIILDSSLNIKEDARVLNLESAAPTWIFCADDADSAKVKRLESQGVVVQRVKKGVNGRLDLNEALDIIGSLDITSLLVEGGATIHGAFLNERLIDRVLLFYAPLFAGDGGIPVVQGYQAGGREDAIRLSRVKTRRLGEDLMIVGDALYP